MWTRQRILIFLKATAVILPLFGMIVYFGSVYDALPNLPERYLPGEGGPARPIGDIPPPERDRRMRQAFGQDCEELKRKSQVYLATKGWCLAIDEFEILPDGRIKLHPFSAAYFPKSKVETRFPEVHTIQCEEAYLTLDKPVTGLTQLSQSKVVAVELADSRAIKVTNNRKSEGKNDDLEMYISEGHLFYEEARNLIWTRGFVKMLDTQSEPLPTQVTAMGMEIALNKDANPNRKPAPPQQPPAPGQPPAKKDAISDVDSITLLANVDMHLYIDSKSGFMAPGQDPERKPAPAPGPKKAPERAHVHIKTNGKFELNLRDDTAHFDAPLAAALAHDRVVVTRTPLNPPPGKLALTDILDCDRLDLKFHKKPDTGEKDIHSAVATARPGAIVELHAENEEMHAFGVEMTYEAPSVVSIPAGGDKLETKREFGPKTVIKGSPMHAIKQGNHIRCVELFLTGANKAGLGQSAYAKGPGIISLIDKKSGKINQHILFKTSFMSNTEVDGNRRFNKLDLTGEPAFIDDETKQEMRASQFIHIWLEEVKPAPNTPVTAALGPQATELAAPPGGPPADPKTSEAKSNSKYIPHKLEAGANVQVRSADLNIRDANHLTVCFRSVAPPSQPKPNIPVMPALGPAGENGMMIVDPVAIKKEGKPAGVTDFPLPGSPQPGAPQPGGPIGPNVDGIAKNFIPKDAKKDGKDAKEKAKRPIEISPENEKIQGPDITAHILIMGDKKELDSFLAERNVHVTQPADNPKDKGLDITGNLLDLVRHPGGDTLRVFGKERKLAQLQFNEMYLFGPEVEIDQVRNYAHVNGTGALHMPSSTGLDGKKQDGHITIHWNKDMTFTGRFAEFDGGVEAFQNTGKLRCQTMQVTLDQPVNFKQTNGGQKSKIDHIVCSRGDRKDQYVYTLEEERDSANKLVTFKRLLLTQAEVDNIEQRLNGSGPGVLDYVGLASGGGISPQQQGPRGGIDPPKDPLKDVNVNGALKKVDDAILKWTRVRFTGQMISYPLPTGNGRVTTFREQVFVMHQPGDDPNVPDPQNIVKDGLYFSCQKLTVIQRKVKFPVADKPGTFQERTTQEMIADGENGLVNFQTAEFRGNAKTVKVDDAQEMIIFEGTPATLFKAPKVQGQPWQRLQGRKVLYNRKTGEFLLDGVNVIQSKLSPEDALKPSLPGSAWERTARTAPPCAPELSENGLPFTRETLAACACGLPLNGVWAVNSSDTARLEARRSAVRFPSSCSV